MPLAAIISLIKLLTHSAPSTTSETLSLLSTHSTALKRALRNPIACTAGTDLFQRYIISTLQSPTSSQTQSTGDFSTTRDGLVTSGEQFVARAQEARGVIATIGGRLVQDGSTVLTAGDSRVVSAVLDAAADKGVRFRVVYVRDSGIPSSSSPDASGGGGDGMVARLRGKGVAVAVIGPSATAYSLGKITMVMVGAEGVVENGGIVSRLGTYQLAMLAKSARKPVYVVAESHKFVRLYPLGQYDLPIQQTVLDFRDRMDDADDGNGPGGTGEEKRSGGGEEDEEPVDYTPPELITALVAETGVHIPSAVSEELIKIWY
ncbi:MAG: hypothetical protein L6R36_001479 [Xanthoria steineri]|nr:MAG: hypothetical protein L6R36_001479 [Xanthoria steineri]